MFTKIIPPQSELLKLFRYCPECGILFKAPSTEFFPYELHELVPAGELNGYNGYITVDIEDPGYLYPSTYQSHRLIWTLMTGEQPGPMIDHANGLRHDNRWSNLSQTDSHANSKNRGVPARTKSGYIGVRQVKGPKKWHATIYVNTDLIDLGKYKSKGEAIRARQEAEARHGFHPNHGKRPAFKSPNLLTNNSPPVQSPITSK